LCTKNRTFQFLLTSKVQASIKEMFSGLVSSIESQIPLDIVDYVFS
jgi:hypothetical protein